MKEESAIKDLKKQAYFAVAWRAQASAQDWVGPLVLESCPAVA